jgi:hypothetical protein
MTKVSQSFYSTAVAHKEIDGLYHATFAVPGEAPLWVNARDGRPKVFRDPAEAELAGFRVMASRLNRSRDVQSFQTKRDRQKGHIQVFRSQDSKSSEEHTVHSVFGNKASK